MAKINRLKLQNSFIKKIIIIVTFIIVGALLFFVAMSIINKSMNELAYDLGEKTSIKDYDDFILKDYESYIELVNKYNIEQNLNESNFEENYYIVSFQEYDSCSESRFKEVTDIKIDNQINISFKIHNKCGWCKKHLALHLIKIDKINEDKEIIYNYTYAKELECGVVK